MLALITRPFAQAQDLCLQLKKIGINSIVFPTIQITSLNNLAFIQQSLTSFQPHKIIFASANAVEAVISQRRYISKDIVSFAVGPGTAKTLQAHDISAIVPRLEQYNSEGLLALPELQQVDAEHIIIFCGEAGRNLLAEGLSLRGAEVLKIPVYKRSCPEVDMQGFLSQWQSAALDYIISTSAESLRNLYHLIPAENRAWLCQQQLVVISPGMALLAEQLGFLLKPIIASNATDSAIVSAFIKNLQQAQDNKKNKG